MKITASRITDLLARRHTRDLFVPEVKNGPTHGAHHFRLDAWAMKRSWANPCMIGYEVKVARSDFLRDDKWPSYLPLCNQLYFAAPHGVIDPDELPPEVGLVTVTKTGTRLMTKRKAAHRQIEPPIDLLCYLLMSRMSVRRDWWDRDERQSDREYWAEWIESKAVDREFGKRVSGEISRRFSEEVLRTQIENERLTKENAALDECRKLLEELGVNWRFAGSRRNAISRAIDQVVPSALHHAIAALRDECDKATKRIDAVRAEHAEGGAA